MSHVPYQVGDIIECQHAIQLKPVVINGITTHEKYEEIPIEDEWSIGEEKIPDKYLIEEVIHPGGTYKVLDLVSGTNKIINIAWCSSIKLA